MEKVIVRAAKIEDCEDCRNLIKQTPELIRGDKNYPSLNWIKSFVKERELFFVAQIDKEIIGFIIGESLIHEGAIAHLLAIKEDYRNNGIGKILMSHFEEEYLKRKIRLILLYRYENNYKTIKFFEKNGYLKGSLVREFEKWIKK